jgi:beta-alanine degradation protein BauB
MPIRATCIALLLFASGCCPAVPSKGPSATSSDVDPARTDGDKYRVVLENDRVRVLRYQDKPGDKTNAHHHPEFVLYALAPFRRRLTFPDGTKKERDLKGGEVIWMPAQTHVGENIGTTDTDALIVELKVR